MILRFLPATLAALCALTLTPATSLSQEYLPGLKWPEPKVVRPGEKNSDPPSDAVVLFDGSDLSAFENADNWRVEDGVMIVGQGSVVTKQAFGDMQLHLEWCSVVPATGSGQDRSNSGAYLMYDGMDGESPRGYEVQILDSYQNPTYYDGQAAAIYKQQPPMVNATRPPGEWNTYDIFWTAPRFNDDDSLRSPAYVTVVHNGVLVQNHLELQGYTSWRHPASYKKHPPKGPIMLQDHGNPVRYRNIWVREYKQLESERVAEPMVRYGDETRPYDSKAAAEE